MTDKTLEIDLITLPSFWAGYLVNANSEGLSESELAEIDSFVESLDGFYCVGTKDDQARFANRNEANSIPCMVETFIFHRKTN